MTSLESMLVNPFGHDGSQPFEAKGQRIKHSKHDEDPVIRKVLKAYDWMLARRSDGLLRNTLDVSERFMLPVLTPAKIAMVLQRVISSYDLDSISDIITSNLVSDLIQESYFNGYNDFRLETGDNSISDFPRMIYGSVNAPKLRYSVIGQSGRACNLGKCIAVHQGSVDEDFAFERCQESEIVVHGDVQNSLGYHGLGCVFTIQGNVGDFPGYESERSRFIFHSEVGKEAGTKALDCYFCAVQRDAYEKLCHDVDLSAGNVVQLIRPDGTVIEEVRI